MQPTSESLTAYFEDHRPIIVDRDNSAVLSLGVTHAPQHGHEMNVVAIAVTLAGSRDAWGEWNESLLSKLLGSRIAGSGLLGSGASFLHSSARCSGRFTGRFTNGFTHGLTHLVAPHSSVPALAPWLRPRAEIGCQPFTEPGLSGFF